MIEAESIGLMVADEKLGSDANTLFTRLCQYKYSYHFNWLGRPIIQFPQDIMALQELIWSIKPDLIIEAGIAHGGSLIFSASMLAVLDMCDAIEANDKLDPSRFRRKVLGIDIDIRAHNRAAIEAHPIASPIASCSTPSSRTCRRKCFRIDPGGQATIPKQLFENTSRRTPSSRSTRAFRRSC